MPADIKTARRAAAAIRKVTGRSVTIKQLEGTPTLHLALCIGYTDDAMGDRAYRAMTRVTKGDRHYEMCANTTGAGVRTLEVV